MNKLTLDDVDVGGKRVLVRADFNVPLEDGKVADDTRIRAALPTIRELLERSAKIILMSHLGKPGGEVKDGLRLDPVAGRLGELLSTEVRKIPFPPDESAARLIREMEEGDVLLFDNTRFDSGEKENNDSLSETLAAAADLYVNDAFAACHRAHASTAGVPRHLSACAGRLVQKEAEELSDFMENAGSPRIGVFGGAKVGGKIDVIRSRGDFFDHVLLGGGMGNTFLAASGKETGASLCDEDSVETARKILSDSSDGRIVLPEDLVVLEDPDDPESHRTVGADEVKRDWRIVDIGPTTRDRFAGHVESARSILWNGPLGWFERAPFDEGTRSLVRAMSGCSARVVIGGGETVQAANACGVETSEAFTHCSTGGGAFLTFVAGGHMPGIDALDDH